MYFEDFEAMSNTDIGPKGFFEMACKSIAVVVPYAMNYHHDRSMNLSSVLVVDDEAMVLSLVKTALAKANFDVETAGAGDEAIRKFNEGEFDLVITDICMPGVDGNMIVHHIKNSPRSATPVVGISGTPWLLNRHDFDSVLSKPFSIKSLVETVKLLTVSRVTPPAS